MGRINENDRIVWIDQLRAVAFLFVIIGHVALPKSIQSLIYSFHMPFFFMISGLTINREKLVKKDIREYSLHQFKRLIIPYFWMCFLMFPLWFFAFHYISNSTTLTIAQAFEGIFIGNNLIKGSPSNALWFILVLFLANILYLILLKVSKGNEGVLLSLICICGAIGYLDKGYPQIWHFNVAFTAVVCLYIGNSFMIWYKRSKNIFYDHKLKITFACMLLAIVGLISHIFNGRISMTANKFGDSILLYYITAMAFSAVITMIITYLPKVKLLTYIGQNTLLYVGIHIPILRIFEKLYPEILFQYKYSIIFAFILWVGIAPICALTNKYAPYVCGKNLSGDNIVTNIVKVLLIAFGAAVPYGEFLSMIGVWDHLNVMISGGILILLSVVFVYITNKYLPIIYLKEKQLH